MKSSATVLWSALVARSIHAWRALAELAGDDLGAGRRGWRRAGVMAASGPLALCWPAETVAWAVVEVGLLSCST